MVDSGVGLGRTYNEVYYPRLRQHCLVDKMVGCSRNSWRSLLVAERNGIETIGGVYVRKVMLKGGWVRELEYEPIPLLNALLWPIAMLSLALRD